MILYCTNIFFVQNFPTLPTKRLAQRLPYQFQQILLSIAYFDFKREYFVTPLSSSLVDTG
ncbi:hypothetical protein XV74_10155 [Vibrio cholerae]|nr:hypothetical protein XV74_10155 [Vibrio cholerae]KQA44388.1 hypothetical protein XV75_13470 [Vibrio cholerae]KQA57034.1 hypothetical protein XV79_11120 [Vibrio cholerae]KQA74710.1 hypothetical protein XV84_10710 [Vibrio cholerae]KQA78096.1 hypothetical protein XV85_11430 [Vibrio cholerae]